jgi:polysaccharide export outer membrane protein
MYLIEISGRFFVMGEVIKLFSTLMHESRMSLSEALSDVGGVEHTTSDAARVYVIGASEQGSDIYHINAKSPGALILGDQFQLKLRDVVYVEAAGVARWNQLIENILPTAQLLSNTRIGADPRR